VMFGCGNYELLACALAALNFGADNDPHRDFGSLSFYLPLDLVGYGVTIIRNLL